MNCLSLVKPPTDLPIKKCNKCNVYFEHDPLGRHDKHDTQKVIVQPRKY